MKKHIIDKYSLETIDVYKLQIPLFPRSNRILYYDQAKNFEGIYHASLSEIQKLFPEGVFKIYVLAYVDSGGILQLFPDIEVPQDQDW